MSVSRISSFLLAIPLLLLPWITACSQESEDAEPDAVDPNEWLIRAYTFPSRSLNGGFASRERGSLRAPVPPADDATEEELIEFLKKSSSVVLHFLEEQGVSMPEGAVVAYDPETYTLVARLPRVGHSSIIFLSENMLMGFESFLVHELTLLQGDAGVIRGAMEAAATALNHRDLLDELRVSDDIEILEETRLESRSGMRSKIDFQRGQSIASDLFLTDDDQVDYGSKEYRSGLFFEIDPILGADESTIDLNLSLTHPLSEPAVRSEPFTFRGERTISSPLTDTFPTSLSSQYTVRSGTTRLLGAWSLNPASGVVEENTAQIAFISADAVKILPVLDGSLTSLVEEHADKVEKIPEGELVYEQVAEEITEGMVVRRFVVPPTFLSSMGSGSSSGAGGAPADPFAAPVESEPRFTIRATAKDILSSAGIQFAPGSSANYLGETSTLIIRNYPDQIELVEAYLASVVSGVEKSIRAEIYVAEGPGSELREFARSVRLLPDHEAQWLELRDRESIRIVDSLYLEGRSGQRSKIESGRLHEFHTGVQLVYPEKEGEVGPSGLVPETENMLIGSSFEMDPVLGADEVTIDFSFSLKRHFAPAERRGEANVDLNAETIGLDGPTTTFHEGSLLLATVYRTGSMRLVGFLKPHGTPEYDNADILQAVFLRLTIGKLE